MSRTIMAFDYGTKSIGSAIGQEITGTASPLKAFKAKMASQIGTISRSKLRNGSQTLSWLAFLPTFMVKI